ncbi:MAG: hypothetical protein ACYTHM_17925 [Planctomycetota bacterium]|jgi:hypothetical protein
MRSLRILLTVTILLALQGWGLARDDRDRDEGKLKMGDRDDALILRINNAIQKGVQWLKNQQRPDGSFRCAWAEYKDPNYRYPWGETALSMLALLKSGANKHDEFIQKGFDSIRRQPLQKVYQVSVLLMALAALYTDKTPPKFDPKELTAVAKKKVNVKGRDLEWMRECVRYLLENRASSMRLFGQDTTGAQGARDCWHYPMGNGDHSNTQLALLGLKAASKCGIGIPDDVWLLTISHFVEVQEKDGPEVRRWRMIEDRKHGYVSYKPVTGVPDRARGWAYSASQYPKGKVGDKLTATTGSMTCVGISNLAIALSELGGKCPGPLKKKAERGIRDGLAWLCHHWIVTENPQHPMKLWHYYYLYGLERVGVLTWTRSIGKHDWYREGAEFLLGAQSGDGHWNCPISFGPINNTCFALLFLTRATVPGRMVITGRH